MIADISDVHQKANELALRIVALVTREAMIKDLHARRDNEHDPLASDEAELEFARLMHEYRDALRAADAGAVALCLVAHDARDTECDQIHLYCLAERYLEFT